MKKTDVTKNLQGIKITVASVGVTSISVTVQTANQPHERSINYLSSSVEIQSQTTRALLFNNSSIFSNHGSIINDYAATTMAT